MTEEKPIVRINSKLYRALFEEGGDKAVAVYALLKHYKKQQSYYYKFKSSNNKVVSNYGLLRNKTNLSLSVLQKYIPILEGMGLCHFANGNFFMLGSNKIDEEYSKGRENAKMIPIVIGTYTETQYYSLSVRVHSEHKQQTTMIKKKTHKRDLLKQLQSLRNSTDNFMCKADYKKALKVEEEYKELEKEGKKVLLISTPVLSCKGYAKLKDGSENKRIKGLYWKKKLMEKTSLETKRRFKYIRKMSYDSYLNFKYSEKMFTKSNINYINGYLAEELTPSFNPIVYNTNSILNLQKLETLKPMQ